jgi:NADH:ubiquinone oxidoreductase subunit E
VFTKDLAKNHGKNTKKIKFSGQNTIRLKICGQNTNVAINNAIAERSIL